MLYIIGGASRCGKTITAKKMAVEKGIPYLSLDWLMMGFTNGIPEYGIHDKLFPDEIAERMWGFLKAMLESMIYISTDCVIEGEAVMPELVIELVKKHSENLKICFVGYTDVDIAKKVREIRQFGSEKGDWLNEESDAYIRDHIKNMVAHSKKIRQSCEKNGIEYIDASKNFNTAMERIIRHLNHSVE